MNDCSYTFDCAILIYIWMFRINVQGPVVELVNLHWRITVLVS